MKQVSTLVFLMDEFQKIVEDYILKYRISRSYGDIMEELKRDVNINEYARVFITDEFVIISVTNHNIGLTNPMIEDFITLCILHMLQE